MSGYELPGRDYTTPDLVANCFQPWSLTPFNRLDGAWQGRPAFRR